MRVRDRLRELAWQPARSGRLVLRARRACVLGIAWLLLVLPAVDVRAQSPPPPANDDSVHLKLRVAWGGGGERAWQGTLRVSPGAIEGVTNLGREPDDPGSTELAGGELKVTHPAPRSYSGLDIEVRGPRTAQLEIELAPRDRPGLSKRLTCTLAELLQQSPTMELDDQHNRLIVTRAPGDRLRVAFERESLVFAPGEEFQFSVQPHLTGFEPGTALRLKAQLLKARGTDELWRGEYDLRVGDDGELTMADPISVRLPAGEGVYDIDLTLAPRRLPGTLGLGLAKPAIQRSLQVVVVDAQAAAADRTPWRTLAEVDPTHGPLGESAAVKWTDWLTRLPQLKWTAGFTHGPLGNGRASRQDHHGHPLVQLAPDGWQAYPLPIQRTDEPHLLEIEYPSDLAQTLAISIIEPNAAGKVVPIGLDSGLDVADPPPGEQSRMLKHRLVFWPRTRAPLVLLVNRRTDRPAVFGKLGVLAGPTRLPPAPATGRTIAASEQRLIAACFDRPIFPENFGAGKAKDPSGEGVWDDWVTFYEGGRRLVEYLKYAGYNAAVITVACEGSALYPSRLLEPNSKYDSGVFFTSGADPVRKDVFELLLRLFDREGLTLIPAIQFATPLPALEQLRRAGDTSTVGLDWVGADGSSWTTRNETNRGLAPYYNALHPSVRAAMTDVVAELEERYSQHASFGGLALQLGPDTYLQLPGESWGLDDTTVARFAADARVRVPGLGPMKFVQRGEYLTGDGRDKWLAWRSRELAETHEQLQAAIARRNPRLKLYLASADVLTSAPVVSQFRPTLPNRPQLDTGLLAVGLDPERYRTDAIVFLRPQRVAPLVSLSNQGLNLELQRSSAVDRTFAGSAVSGVHWYHESLPMVVPSFDAVSPFGPENTHTWLATHAAPAGMTNRKRLVRSLGGLDAQVVFDGGWMLPIGSEDDVRSIYAVYRQLPSERFQTVVANGSNNQTQPLIVRQLSRGQQTFVYVVNDAPWSVTGQVELAAPAEFRALPLGDRPAPHMERTGDGWRWTVKLQPYDVQAIMLTAPKVAVTTWKVLPEPQIAAQLGQRVQDLRTRASRLRAPQPYDVLRNPGFELPSKEGVPHWLFAQGPGLQVQLDRQLAHQGQQSLRLASDQNVVWLRSPTFPTPTTGRLAVWVWLKVASNDEQPPLRLAIEGQLDGRTYYRFATVGSGKSAASPLNPQWTQYWFQVDDLPTTGLTDLRVGFDLMGAGEVWIDDVQIFDLWFYDNERDELIKSIGLADFHLSNGQVGDCQRFLEGYWPQFLKQHVSRESLVVRNPATRPAPTAKPPAAHAPEDPATAEKTSWKNRMNGLLPKKMRQ